MRNKARILPCILAFFSFILYDSCGKGGGGGKTNSVGDDPRPLSGHIRVVSHKPVDRAVQVPLDSKIEITFDSPIKEGCFSAEQIIVKPDGGTPLLGDFSLDPSHKTVTFTPSESFRESTDYTVTISTLVYDLNYRTLGSEYSFSFRTLDRDPPTIVSTIPKPGDTSVSPKCIMVIDFSEELDRSSVSESTVKLRDIYGDEVPMSITLDGTRLLAVPKPDLAGGSHYQFTIKGREQGVKDRSGNPLAEDLKIGFDTGWDETPPTVVGTVPPSDSEDVAPGAVIRVTFSDSIDP